jgi:hypothetical protein
VGRVVVDEVVDEVVVDVATVGTGGLVAAWAATAGGVNVATMRRLLALLLLLLLLRLLLRML